jgi:hypothetical protein
MRSTDARIVSLIAVAIALAGDNPPRDARPPYHEPAAAKPASDAAVPTPHPADQPVR